MRVPFVDLKAQLNSIRDDVYRAIAEVVESTEFIQGKVVNDFETAFARYCGLNYCRAVANGTDALVLALKALDLKPGQRVITVPNTFIASSESITYAGGVVDFVDIESRSMLMDCNQLEEKVKLLRSSNIPVAGIIPVHLYGHPCDMESVMSIANRYELFVIEDAAQAHGAMSNDKPIGSFGDIATFSFFPGKNLGAYGDAGAVVTNNKALYEKVMTLSNHGRSPGMKYEHHCEGFNSRLDSIQAAVLRVKLPLLDQWTDQRIANADKYRELLLNKTVSSLPLDSLFLSRSVYHLYVIRSPQRNALKEYLSRQGIDTGIHYPIPLHLQPAYHYLGYSKGSFPHSERAAQEILSLPMFAELTHEQIEYVCKSILCFESQANIT